MTTAVRLHTAYASLLALAALLTVLAAGPAKADSLDSALRSGKVGETTRGYIAPVSSPTPAITSLVNDINSRRRAEYQAIAQRNNISLGQVEALAGKRIIERAPAGTYVQDNGGGWRRK